MISHERLDRLAGQFLPRRTARKFADFANRRTAADYDTVVCTTGFALEEFDRIGATNTVTVPLGVDLEMFHPRRRSALVRQRWAAPIADPAGPLRPAVGGKACRPQHRRRRGVVRRRASTPGLVVVGEGPLRAQLAASGRWAAGRFHRFRLRSACRRRAAGLGRCHACAGAARDVRAGRTGVAGLRDAGRGLAHVGAERDHHPGQRRLGRQQPGGHRTRGPRDRQPARTPPPRLRAGAEPRCSPGSGRPSAC